MISICPKCHNHGWDKEVKENKTIIRCPHCQHEWPSTGLPLFILTGCSSVGKTTVGMALLQCQKEVIVLDADYFQFMPSETLEDWAAHIERQEEISADMMQSGRPVLWTRAGCIDRLYDTYHERFFNGIYCLALTCEPEELRRRMTEGRGITSEEWIQSSIDYNQYFREHDHIGQVPFSSVDITHKSLKEITDYVMQWVNNCMKKI